MAYLVDLPQTWRLAHLMHPSCITATSESQLLEIDTNTRYSSPEALLAIALSEKQFANYGIPTPETPAFSGSINNIYKLARLMSIAQLALRASGNAEQLYIPNQPQNRPTRQLDPLNAIIQLNSEKPNSLRTSDQLNKEYLPEYEEEIFNNTIGIRHIIYRSSQFVGFFSRANSSDQALATQMLYLRAARRIPVKQEDINIVDQTLIELSSTRTAFQN